MSCPEFRSGVTRRGLLAASLATGAAVAISEHVTAQSATASASADTLVVLSLRGGFDGLSAVIPVADPDYYRARPQLGIPQSKALPLDRQFALHPALAPLLPLWRAGKLGIVHATGMTKTNRSHFSAMAEMERAAPGSSLRTGWLQRAVGYSPVAASSPFRTAVIGSGQPLSVIGPQPATSFASLKNFALSAAGNPANGRRWMSFLESTYQDHAGPVGSAARATLAALGSATQIAKAPYRPAPDQPYPNSALGRALTDAAQLIKSAEPISVITVDVGNWDMHEGLGSVDHGWMVNSLTELGAALAAFASDLGSALDRVMLVTLSEFGRRVAENGSGGVDHGWGNAMFILGGGARGGTVQGIWPGLAEAKLVEGDLRATTDYRAVLADILVNRCGASLAEARMVFPGWTGAPLGVVAARV